MLTEKQRQLVIDEAIRISKLPRNDLEYECFVDPEERKLWDCECWYDICKNCFKTGGHHYGVREKFKCVPRPDSQDTKQYKKWIEDPGFERHPEASIMLRALLRMII